VDGGTVAVGEAAIPEENGGEDENTNRQARPKLVRDEDAELEAIRNARARAQTVRIACHEELEHDQHEQQAPVSRQHKDRATVCVLFSVN
jgi:hypothetical protein